MNTSIIGQQWLEENPYPMMAMDETGFVQWTNPAFQTLCNLTNDLIIGSSSDKPPAPNLADLLSTKSNVQLIHPERGEILLERIIKTLENSDGSNIHVHFFQEKCSSDAIAKENFRLKQQVENLTLTDELTGLANERALSQNLATQVTRSRRYNNPLTLALVDIEIPDEGVHILDEHYNDAVISISHFLRERLRWADFIARCGAGRFVIVLPETAQEEAHRLFTDIINDKDKIDLPDDQKPFINLHFGIAEWEKGNDPKILVKRASQAVR